MRREVRCGLVSAGSVALVALALSNASLHAQPAGSTAPIRGYYLTTGTFTGSQALTACASGYHMASYFEISGPSMLRYETSLGLTAADSGMGPPTYNGANLYFGWIRSGGDAGVGQTQIYKNCNVWTSSGASDWGTAAAFVAQTTHPVPTIESLQGECDWALRVWCVQD